MDVIQADADALVVALRKESVDRNADDLGGRRDRATSLSARRAWIEIHLQPGCRLRWPVALRKESVDRNLADDLIHDLDGSVALRKESVDRNSMTY